MNMGPPMNRFLPPMTSGHPPLTTSVSAHPMTSGHFVPPQGHSMHPPNIPPSGAIFCQSAMRRPRPNLQAMGQPQSRVANQPGNSQAFQQRPGFAPLSAQPHPGPNQLLQAQCAQPQIPQGLPSIQPQVQMINPQLERMRQLAMEQEKIRQLAMEQKKRELEVQRTQQINMNLAAMQNQTHQMQINRLQMGAIVPNQPYHPPQTSTAPGQAFLGQNQIYQSSNQPIPSGSSHQLGFHPDVQIRESIDQKNPEALEIITNLRKAHQTLLSRFSQESSEFRQLSGEYLNSFIAAKNAFGYVSKGMMVKDFKDIVKNCDGLRKQLEEELSSRIPPMIMTPSPPAFTGSPTATSPAASISPQRRLSNPLSGSTPPPRPSNTPSPVMPGSTPPPRPGSNSGSPRPLSNPSLGSASPRPLSNPNFGAASSPRPLSNPSSGAGSLLRPPSNPDPGSIPAPGALLTPRTSSKAVKTDYSLIRQRFAKKAAEKARLEQDNLKSQSSNPGTAQKTVLQPSVAEISEKSQAPISIGSTQSSTVPQPSKPADELEKSQEPIFIGSTKSPNETIEKPAEKLPDNILANQSKDNFNAANVNDIIEILEESNPQDMEFDDYEAAPVIIGESKGQSDEFDDYEPAPAADKSSNDIIEINDESDPENINKSNEIITNTNTKPSTSTQASNRPHGNQPQSISQNPVIPVPKFTNFDDVEVLQAKITEKTDVPAVQIKQEPTEEVVDVEKRLETERAYVYQQHGVLYFKWTNTDLQKKNLGVMAIFMFMPILNGREACINVILVRNPDIFKDCGEADALKIMMHVRCDVIGNEATVKLPGKVDSEEVSLFL